MRMQGLPHTRYGLQRRDEYKRLLRCILSIDAPVGISLSAQGVICREPSQADILTGDFDLNGGALYETGNR